ASGLVCAETLTSDKTVPVGGVHLDRLRDPSTREAQSAASTAIAALPAGVIAHRLGDFVFTYHGVTGNPPDAGLWIVVCSPDPDLNGTAAGNVIAATVGGWTTMIPPAGLARALARQ